MLIAYENLYVLEPEQPYGEKTRLAACAAGRVMVTLDTRDFDIQHKDGIAEVHLARHMTHQQARDFANSILQAVDKLEEQEKQWQVITSTNKP